MNIQVSERATEILPRNFKGIILFDFNKLQNKICDFTKFNHL